MKFTDLIDNYLRDYINEGVIVYNRETFNSYQVLK